MTLSLRVMIASLKTCLWQPFEYPHVFCYLANKLISQTNWSHNWIVMFHRNLDVMRWKKRKVKRLAVHPWPEPPVFCCWATTAGQPPTLTILYIYCTGSTECLSHTPGSHCCEDWWLYRNVLGLTLSHLQPLNVSAGHLLYRWAPWLQNIYKAIFKWGWGKAKAFIRTNWCCCFFWLSYVWLLSVTFVILHLLFLRVQNSS